MKKNITYLTIIFSLSIFNIYAQTGNIRFTAKKNPAQDNQILIYGKNFSVTLISGIVGSSNITLCVAFPNTQSGTPTISSPIGGQTFDAPLKNVSGSDSIYTWNGLGATSAVDFPGGGTTEVLLAAVTFNTGAPGVTATVKIADVALAGPSGFDYCYIAPGGIEHSGYSTPFYSNIASDPLLINSGGANDVSLMGNSSLGISNVALPVKFLGFNALKKDNNALLNWQIENESAITDRYEVERSLNGLNFSTIATLLPKKNGRSTNSYDLSDLNISAIRSTGVIYYRIKQVDKDGQYVTTNIKNIRLNSKGIAMAIFPNPVKDFATVSLEMERDTDVMITINDASGKQVQNIPMQLFKGSNIKKINMSTLASGSYMLQINTGDEIKTIPLVKTN